MHSLRERKAAMGPPAGFVIVVVVVVVVGGIARSPGG